MKYSDYAELLDVFCWGVGKLTQPTLVNLLSGYEEYAHRSGTARLIQQLRHQELIAAHGRGQCAKFTLTEKGRQRVRVANPEPHWNHKWDGAWRIVTFDLPETRRKDRKRLWQALRAQRLGLLQRSVWIWPHDVTPILREIIQIKGVPECFCGFQATKVFLCSNEEIVAAAWEWEEIIRRQKSYLQHLVATESNFKAARDALRLGELARIEKQAYDHAFLWDPLLPQSLWPSGYLGRAVQQRHLLLRTVLGARLAELQNL